MRSMHLGYHHGDYWVSVCQEDNGVFRCGQGICGKLMKKWNTTQNAQCAYGYPNQRINHIIENCPLFNSFVQ